MSRTLDLHLIYMCTPALTIENLNTDGEFPYQPLASKSSDWSGITRFSDFNDNALHLSFDLTKYTNSPRVKSNSALLVLLLA